MLITIPFFIHGGEFHTGEFLLSAALSLLFLIFVPRGDAAGALALSAGGLLTVIFFWTGLPMPLAPAGAVTAWRARRRGDRPGLATAALAVSALAVLALAGLAITDPTYGMPPEPRIRWLNGCSHAAGPQPVLDEQGVPSLTASWPPSTTRSGLRQWDFSHRAALSRQDHVLPMTQPIERLLGVAHASGVPQQPGLRPVEKAHRSTLLVIAGPVQTVPRGARPGQASSRRKPTFIVTW